MKDKNSITKDLTKVLSKEQKQFAKKGNTLSGIYDKFFKLGIETKTTYSLPLKDTIGKTFNEQIQFKNK